MMYKILNKLFGWDYVCHNYISGSEYSKTCRVEKFGSGEVGFWFKGVLKIVEDPDDVSWLTCHPSKYLYDYDFEEYEKLDNLDVDTVLLKLKQLKKHLSNLNINGDTHHDEHKTVEMCKLYINDLIELYEEL